MLSMTGPQIKLIIDSIVWAFRHTERNVAEEGLSLLLVRHGARRPLRASSIPLDTDPLRLSICSDGLMQ